MELNSKPTEITAKQFVDDGYAEKIARGECEVFVDTYKMVKSCEKTGAVYTTFLVDTSEYRQDTFRYFYADQQFKVVYPTEIERIFANVPQDLTENPPATAQPDSTEAGESFGEPVNLVATSEMTVKELVMLPSRDGLVAEYHGKEILLINDGYEDMAWPIYYVDGSSESVTYNTRVQVQRTGYFNMTAMPTAAHRAKSVIAALRAQSADKDAQLAALESELAAAKAENARLTAALEAIAKPMSDKYSLQYRNAERRVIAKNALNGHGVLPPAENIYADEIDK